MSQKILKSILFTFSMLPLETSALTGGPVMPEYTQFEEVSNSNLVDLHSGNFNYSIPLIEVPGPAGSYPIGVSYHSGITHGQEATWVGLGWTLNAGSVNRVLRGVPDDYLNSVVTTKTYYYAEGSTINVNLGLGAFGLSMAWDANTGSFKGATPSLQFSLAGFNSLYGSVGLNLTLSPGGASIGMGSSTQIGSVNSALYDTQREGGRLKANYSFGGGMRTGGGSSVGVSAGPGKLSTQSASIGFPIGALSVNIGLTSWQYKLDVSSSDFMCGYLFQNGGSSPFVKRASDALPYYYSGPDPRRRQRFDRSRQDDKLYLSSDAYNVASNGLGGAFSPFLEPNRDVSPIIYPVVLDANDANTANNEGYLIQTPRATQDIVFRMEEDPGYQLIQNDEGGQAPGDEFDTQLGLQQQYGSVRIVPIFETASVGMLNRLKGFVITNADGVRYEYLQPVHTLWQVDFVVNHFAKVVENRNEKLMPDKYAASWLLTAVKGADYVPINNASGSPQDQDLGHWVKFSYSAPVVTTWSAPFDKNMPHERGDKVLADGTNLYTRTYGHKELVYLEAIETKTHIARFNRDERLDARLTKNNPMTAPDGTLIMNSLTKDLVTSIETVPFTVYDNPNPPSQITTSTWTLTFPGNWVDECEAYALGFARMVGATDIEAAMQQYRRDCFEFTARFQWDNSGSWPTTTSTFSSPSCTVLRLNAMGDTEADCTISNFSYNGRRVRKVEILGGGLNWINLEHYAFMSDYFQNPKLLKNVSLFEKPEMPALNMPPIKSIDFKYNYSLCGGTPNSSSTTNHPDLSRPYYVTGSKNQGKLTLKKIVVKGTYQNGSTPELPPYEFTYQDGAENPDFGGEMKKDVWGMFSPTGDLDHHLTKQKKTSAPGQVVDGGEMVGVCWNLTGIRMPSGGSINVSYKRDSYYLAGLGIDAVTGNQIAVPDIFNIDAPLRSSNPTLIDEALLAKVINSTGSSTLATRPNMDNISSGNHGYGTNQVPLKAPGPAGEEDFVQVNQIPTGLQVGDFALVFYDFSEKTSPEVNWSQKHRGVMNLTVVKSISTSNNRLELHPVIQQRVSGGVKRLFLYKDFIVDNPSPTPDNNYKFDFYLLPIKGNGRSFYGGDVAVSEITMGDGFGNQNKTRYTYSIQDIRNTNLNNVVSNYPTSSGASYGLPSLYFDKFYRFWESNHQSNLRYDSWPRFFQGCGGGTPCYLVSQDKVTKTKEFGQTWANPVANWVNQAYLSEFKMGGYHFPAPGVSYSRVIVEQIATDPTSGLPVAGYGGTEHQFHNISHRFLNEGQAFNPSSITAGFEYNEWKATQSSPQTLDIYAGSLSKSGKLIRSIVWPAGEAGIPPQIDENQYSATYNQDQGHIKQTTGSRVGAVNPEKISMVKPYYFLTKEISTKDGVKTEVANTYFDFKSGTVTTQQKTNSDGSILKEERVMEHIRPGFDVRSHNRLNLISQEKTSYFPPPSGSQPLRPVIKATHNIWMPLPRIAAGVSGIPSPLFKAKTLVFDPVLGDDGYPGPLEGFQEPILTNGKPQSPWKITEDIRYLNQYSYPIERFNPYDGSYVSEYTGHGGNLIIGRVSGARHQDVSVFTGDYDLAEAGPGLGYYDKTAGWMRYKNNTVSMEKHCGNNTIVVFNTNGPTIELAVDPVRNPKYVLTFHARPYGSTATRGFIQPRVGTTPVGPMVYTDVFDDFPTSGLRWKTVKVEIDLSQSQYAGATVLYAGVTLNPISGLDNSCWVDNLRIFPKGTLVTTYFHDKALGKIVSIVDESGIAKKAEYDGLGRLKALKNNANQTLTEADYGFMVNPN